MLTNLHIENIAVIKDLDIDFNGGFTVFTGETGAGKSIIINSISLLCGEKIQKDMIRTGESDASVSALLEDQSAISVAKVALRRANAGESGTDAQLVPVYLRLPQAERERLEKLKQ